MLIELNFGSGAHEGRVFYVNALHVSSIEPWPGTGAQIQMTSGEAFVVQQPVDEVYARVGLARDKMLEEIVGETVERIMNTRVDDVVDVETCGASAGPAKCERVKGHDGLHLDSAQVRANGGPPCYVQSTTRKGWACGCTPEWGGHKRNGVHRFRAAAKVKV
jgi:uncharacterized protein YlzI (FlbEa/FlbD family)